MQLHTITQIITGIDIWWSVSWGKALRDHMVVAFDHYGNNDH